jgi:hypothetical protein
MKTIKQILFVLFFIIIVIQAYSTENVKVRGDSVRIRFENCLLEIAAFDLSINSLKDAGIQLKVNELLTELEKVEIVEPADGEKICIKWSGYIGGKEQEFKKLEMISIKNSSKLFVVSEGNILETDFGKIVFEIEDENYLIRLHLEKLADAKMINSQDFFDKIRDADSKIPNNRKKINAWLIENNTHSFNTHFLNEVPPLTLDMLELNAGVGAGWIYNQFVSSFNFRLGFAFAKKGILRNRYFVDHELLYDFSNPQGENKFDLNGFLSLGYERNFSLDPNKAKWYGISAGFMVIRNGNFFEKNTFRISVHRQVNNSITIKPEIYFNDFVKNGTPALKVQIAF